MDIKKEIISTILYFIIIFALVFFTIHFVGQRTVVNGHSMDNTLSDGESLIVDKLTYRFSDPKRYDIVIFPSPDGDNSYFIKRIIGLPGETVQIIDEEVYINGEPLGENYGITKIEYYGIAEQPLTLSEDEYFVLGDNRPVSRDSRYEDVGPIKKSELKGRAILRVWPLSSFGKIKNGNA